MPQMFIASIFSCFREPLLDLIEIDRKKSRPLTVLLRTIDSYLPTLTEIAVHYKDVST